MTVGLTFTGKIEVHVSEVHHHHVRSLEDEAFHNVFLSRALAGFRDLPVGCIEDQVTLGGQRVVRAKSLTVVNACVRLLPGANAWLCFTFYFGFVCLT